MLMNIPKSMFTLYDTMQKECAEHLLISLRDIPSHSQLLHCITLLNNSCVMTNFYNIFEAMECI